MFTLLVFGIQAQTNVYHPFPESGVAWREDQSDVSFDCCCSGGNGDCIRENRFQFFLGGDTVIQSQVSKKLYASGSARKYVQSTVMPSCPAVCDDYTLSYYYGNYKGAIRQDISARKVYFTEISGEESLLYDFSLDVGDTLSESYNSMTGSNKVSRIDSVLVGGVYHKRFWLTYIQGGWNLIDYVSIIEGIGSTYGLLFMLQPPFEHYGQNVCVRINETAVYPAGTLACENISSVSEMNETITFSFSPNPLQDISTLQVSDAFADASLFIFSGTGKEVQHQQLTHTTATVDRKKLEEGIYFFMLVNDKGQTSTGKFSVQD